MASDPTSTSPQPDPSAPQGAEGGVLFEDVNKRPLTAETAAVPPQRPGGGEATPWSGVYGTVVPDRVGNYTITRLIGAGGMGAVFEAIQDQPRRAVALKLLRAGLASEKALRRFQTECDVLARLKHPCIAQIYDAGTHESALGPVPYFAMELVGGPDAALAAGALAGSDTAALGGGHGPALNVVDYARQKELTVAQKLDLMASICDAVQHAHDHRVIHRDLKPDNILVDPGASLPDSRGQSRTGSTAAAGLPKIIDFGIARLADPADQSRDGTPTSALPVHTTHGHAIGTLAYMSPEQTLGDPAKVDHRSDIYALGVVLYELLTGQMPYQTLGVGREEGARMVREARPTPPSKHNAALSGDIENIVLKALRRDKHERYQSAGEMRDDLRRVLAGERARARKLKAIGLLRRGLRDWAANHPVVATLAAMALAIGLGLWCWYAPLAYAPDVAWQRMLADIHLPIHDLEKVCVIGVDEGMDEPAIRAALAHAGFPDLDPGNVRSLRPIYAKFLTEKLAESGAPAVAFDITVNCRYSYKPGDVEKLHDFPPDTPDIVVREAIADLPPDAPDIALRDAIADLLGRRPPIPVIFTYDDFPRERDRPISVLAIDDGKAKFGSTYLHPGPGLWWNRVFEKPKGADPRPSLSLALCANARHPGYQPSYRWDARTNDIEVQFTASDVPGAAPDTSRVQRYLGDSSRYFDPAIDGPAEGQGALPEDWICTKVVYMPDDECLTRATLPLSKALSMSADELRTWVRGRAVVVGNLLAKDDYHPYGRARMVSGVYCIALSAESLAGGLSFTLMNGSHAWAGLTLFAALGAAIAWTLRWTAARAAAIVILIGLLLGSGWVLFSTAHYQLVYPTCLVISLLMATTLASSVVGAWRSRLA